MTIPFVDLRRQYLSIKDDIDSVVLRVINDGNYILGDNVLSFEKEFAKYCNVEHAVGVASGTDALILSLRAFDISKNDEVITVPNTFIATVDAISRNEAKPVFIDIDPNTYNIDVTKIEKKITQRTKAIIPVHLYGQLCDMKEINQIAEDYNLRIIEDTCQAHGVYRNSTIFSSDTGCFSFYPSKNLGTYGDGGIIVTNNDNIAKELKTLRNYGQIKKYYHDFIGYNSRLDEIHAAILRVKLRHLDKWNNLRRQHAKLYNELLKDIDYIKLPVECNNKYDNNDKYSDHVYHLYVIRCRNKLYRDRLQKYLLSKGISTGIHYPVPIHLQKAYKYLNYRNGDFPIAEDCANRILSLPMFPELTNDEIEFVCNCIKEFI